MAEGKPSPFGPENYSTPLPSLEDDNSGLFSLNSNIKDGGWLWLAVDGRGDDFYSTEVRPPHRHHDLTQFIGVQKIGFGKGELWTDGRGHSEPLSILMEGCQTKLTGFYWDQFNAATGKATEYEVCIYLTIEN